MDATDLILIVHFAATWYMVGIIWFVQWVHYPLFDRIGDDSFADYQLAHIQRTSHIVLVPMFIEAGTAGLLLLSRPPEVDFLLAVVGAAMVAMIWLTTLFLQVPRHDRLTQGYDAAAYTELLATNWLRTVLWSGRGLLVAWMLLQIISALR